MPNSFEFFDGLIRVSNEFTVEGIAAASALMFGLYELRRGSRQNQLANYIQYSFNYHQHKKDLPRGFYRLPRDYNLSYEEHRAATSMVSFFNDEFEHYKQGYWSKTHWKKFNHGMEKFIESEQGQHTWVSMKDDPRQHDLDERFCEYFDKVEAKVLCELAEEKAQRRFPDDVGQYSFQFEGGR